MYKRQEYNVDPLLVFAVIKAESNFKKDATSTSNAIGLMQLMENTAIETGEKVNEKINSKEELYNPKINVKIGIKYLSELLERYDGNLEIALAAYNAGIGNVTEWIQKGIIKKELKQYFYSMVGFVFLAFFLAIVGLYTWAGNLSQGIGNFEMTLGNMTFIFVILIPILTMRIVAEEKKQKTDQLLYTSPISLTKVILGKYIAVMILFTIAILVIALLSLIHI